jgi:NAD(P)-dependent dehydrogenase (short-subunit alcohol dehydrogenase family)
MPKKHCPPQHQKQRPGHEHKMSPRPTVADFGCNVRMKRAGRPMDAAPCYVFLPSADSACMTGQVLHPNGGEIING